MRRRSLTGPLLLLLIGGLFLWSNLHPGLPVFEMVAQYWPFLLIVWGLLRLVEILLSRDDHWRSSFTGGEVALIVLICIAGSGIWAARMHGVRFRTGGLEWFGEQYDYPIAAHGSAAGMKRIVVEDPGGNIKVTGADTQDVTVTGHKLIRAYARTEADSTSEKTPVEVVPQGDRVLIRTNQDRAPDSQRISDDLEITVPRGTSVEARGRQGDYEISDIAGDVELATDRGDVRLARVGGNVRLEVGRSDVVRAADIKGTIDVSGRGTDVSLENIGGQVTINGSYVGTLEFKNLAKPLQFEGTRSTELHAQAVPGRISMDLSGFTGSGLTGPVRLVTGSQDVTVEQFTKAIEVQTQRGDIELHAGSPTPAIEAQSDAGRIELVLPAKATFDLQATAGRGDATNDYGPEIHQDTDGRAATLKGKVGEGPTIRLTSRRSSVSVRKEGAPSSDDDSSGAPQTPKTPKPPKEVKL